jgi:acyl carrier protein
LVDALGVDEEEVTPSATMVGDLGAESIDFLDIVFRLEKAFDIKIHRGELFPEAILNNAEYLRNAKVTPAGIGSSEADAVRRSLEIRGQSVIAGHRPRADCQDRCGMSQES